MKIDLDRLIELRHWLHSHPEVSRTEFATAKYIRMFLEKHATPDEIIALDGAGIAAVFAGVTPGKTVLIRAELDALPIHEVNEDIPYRSIYNGVGHKCGHDGHMTILAGLAQVLNKRPPSGRVILLFQPDEETGTGALGCNNHVAFKSLTPDFVFALHNIPGLPKRDIACKTGTFASTVKYIAVTFTGKEGHSAHPENGVSPSFALAELTLLARKVQTKYNSEKAYALIVPIYNQMGVKSSGVCPGKGEAHFTLRSGEGAVVDAMLMDFLEGAKSLAAKFSLHLEWETIEEFGETANSKIGFDMIRQAAALADLNFRELEQPFRWGEDFGEFTKRYEGGMFGLGIGENHSALHSPDYDFPDDLLETGVNMFAKLVNVALSSR